MKENNTYKLKVIAGVHKDAELPLDERVSYHIGNDDACDIVLLDDGVIPKHFSLIVSDGKIHLENFSTDLYIDGKKLKDRVLLLKPFQVITVGDAHLAVGPLSGSWPALTPPVIEEEEVLTYALMITDEQPVLTEKSLFEKIADKFHAVYLFFQAVSPKLLTAGVVFFLLFAAFWVDFFRSGIAPINGNEEVVKQLSVEESGSNSLFLSAASAFASMRDDTLVKTGIKEPKIDVFTPEVEKKDPTNMLRDVLKRNWGEKLQELPGTENEIRFRAYSDQNTLDLDLSVNKDSEKHINASGFTRYQKQKKEIVSQLGDVIRMKIHSAEDMEGLCKKVLLKKGVRNPKADFEIAEASLNLGGESSSLKTIEAVQELIEKAIPDIRINSDIKYALPKRLNITGVSMSGNKYVKMADGSQVFLGGKVNSGCVVAQIEPKSIQLECNGKDVTYIIGGKD